ncbi:hypothetical protein ACKKBG_A09530 [Auxenochlorella protothecoides x Auxenochlorella symbiontica]
MSTGQWPPMYPGMAGGPMYHHPAMGWNVMNAQMAPQMPAFPPGHPMYPPAPPGQAAPPYQPATTSGELRTVFITGFPPDIKERELPNLLRFLPGYEACQLHTRAGAPLGFALFSSTHAAQAAVRALSALAFDPEHPLRAQLARNNMNESGGPGRWAGQGASALAGNSSPTRDHPACNTLYIGNLGDATEERELNDLFGSYAGFQRLRLLRGSRTVSAFVVFEDTATASAAREGAQGSSVPSSDRGPLRIQFSRNPSSNKRDAASAQLPQDGGWIAGSVQRPRQGDYAAAGV